MPCGERGDGRARSNDRDQRQGPRTTTKHQAPRAKDQGPRHSQTPTPKPNRRPLWELGIGSALVLGPWSLVLGAGPWCLPWCLALVLGAWPWSLVLGALTRRPWP